MRPLEQALELYERDDHAAAASAFERAIAVDPGDVDARYKLANCRKELGQWPEAAEQYRAVLERDPEHARALNNLGAVQEALGQAAAAEASYRRALECEAGLTQPYANLGRLLMAQGRTAEAGRVFSQAIAAGLDPDFFGHLSNAARGAASPRAPDSYVRGTFDAFAAQFDRQLGELGYRVPQEIARLARGHFGSRRPATLDLGCGTGLAGEALKGGFARLVGVDLSSGMLEVARRRGCYEELHAAEIGEWLVRAPQNAFDLVVAADVFIYIGELETVFAGLARCLRPEGALAFSVESCTDADWKLLPSGRYAQSTGYIGRLAAAHGFALASREPAVIRSGVAGELYLLVTR